MKISLEWLKDYIDVDKSPEQVADDLSLFGQEVDSVKEVGEDVIYNLEITPNRGDCLSILGIARELAAFYNVKLKVLPRRQAGQSSKLQLKTEKVNKKLHIKISNPKLCPRFTARIIDGIKIGDSPKWMQERLATYGFRAVNNVVDVTNYVMVATGQPLHAFDYDKIKDGLMNVRPAKKGEEVMTLDGQNRVLNEGAIIIEDGKKIYDLAGIMGGFKSEVDVKTKTIILQGAIFDPTSIRKTSKYLNHVTDASYRYERGVDYEGTIPGVNMAAELIKKIIPEAKIGELIDQKAEELDLAEIEVDLKKVNALLGINISIETAGEYLGRLNFKVKIAKNKLMVAPPSYRKLDITIWQDVAEELARLYGYNNIPLNNFVKQSTKIDSTFQKREYIKDYLTDFNYSEIYSYSFAEKDKIILTDFDINDCLEIANPLSDETQYLRPSLLTSILTAVANNPWSPEIKIFEIEKVFDREGERWQLAIVSVGKDESDLKERIKFLGISDIVQSIDQKILAIYKIRRPVKYAIINLDNIKVKSQPYNNEVTKNKYKIISKFPPSIRDLAFVMAKDTSVEEVERFILDLNQNILLCENFDDFIFEDGRRNLAYHLWFQNLKGPVDTKEIDFAIKAIINKVESHFGAKLRSK